MFRPQFRKDQRVPCRKHSISPRNDIQMCRKGSLLEQSLQGKVVSLTGV